MRIIHDLLKIKTCFFFLMIFMYVNAYASNHFVSGSISVQNDQVLTGSKAFSQDQQDDQNTAKAMTEIQKALEEYEWKMNASCPNIVKLLNDSKFLEAILPTLTEKYLTARTNSPILKTFFKHIPFLRINDQPITPKYLKSLQILTKIIETFIREYKTLNIKSMVNELRRSNTITTTHNTVINDKLLNHITSILNEATTSISEIRKTILYQDFYSIQEEKRVAIEAFNHIKSMISLITVLISDERLFKTLLTAPYLDTSPEIKTIKDKIDKISQEVPIENTRKPTHRSSERNSESLLRTGHLELPSLEKMLKTVSRFAQTKIPASTELADNLDQQGHLVFKIDSSSKASSDEAEIIIRFFDPTITGKYIRNETGVTEIKFPSGIKENFEAVKQEFNELRNQYRALQAKASALISTTAAAPGSAMTTVNATANINEAPASENAKNASAELLSDSQDILARIKALQYKLNIAINLETLQDYSDITKLPHGLYIFVNPHLHFASPYSLRELVESVQFKSGNTLNLRRSERYAMSYKTWDQVPLRSRVSLIRSAGQFFTKNLGTKCQLRFADECQNNFSSFLHSVRYCKFSSIQGCINAASSNSTIDIILGNFYDYLQEDETISQTSEQSKILLTTATTLANNIIDNRSTFIRNERHRENVVWFILLVELLQREATLDNATPFKNNRDTNAYLEKLLIDAAYHISNIANNMGFSFLNKKALSELTKLASLTREELENRREELENRRNQLISNIEVADKMKLLNISNELARLLASTDEINQQANAFGKVGPSLALISSTNNAINQILAVRVKEKDASEITRREQQQNLLKVLGVESGNERQEAAEQKMIQDKRKKRNWLRNPFKRRTPDPLDTKN